MAGETASETGQHFYNAIDDYNKALNIKPNDVYEEYDPTIKEQVDKALITGAFDKSSQILKKTESRFFVFTQEGKILYYKSKKDATNSKTIEITASSEIKKSENDRSHHINIVTISRTYKLMFRSAEELNDWHTTLTKYQKTLPKPETEAKPDSSKKTTTRRTR
ncbi:8942_t:CDS:2 [Paraglomus brasilianum]|uniref:8942_t:CDS:1 n=1 Tax=Paraglomus brasilianum TaxID=144538 RepID=A0A9N9CGJ6_9GLOM|nr:8942_t:CDS:2 [Paraglomus brasilianum]